MSEAVSTAATQPVESLITAGIDVGSSAVKIAIVRLGSSEDVEVLALRSDRIRRRDLRQLIAEDPTQMWEERRIARSIRIAEPTG